MPNVAIFAFKHYGMLSAPPCLSALKITGTYKTGVRYYRTRATGMEVSIYYPIDHCEYAINIDSRNAPIWRYPEA